MLWIDVASRSINRAYLNGSEKVTLIDSDMRTPGESQLLSDIQYTVYKCIHACKTQCEPNNKVCHTKTKGRIYYIVNNLGICVSFKYAS